MITKQHLKIFLSFLSLMALLLGSCSAEDKLGSGTQSSQVSGGSSGRRTNLPIWTMDYVYGSEISDGSYIPKIYVGNYVPSFYGTVVGTNYINPGAYGYLIYKATYLGYNTWSWDKNGLPGLAVDEGDLSIYKLSINEKGQRILTQIGYDFSTKEYYTNTPQIHEDDVNK